MAETDNKPQERAAAAPQSQGRPCPKDCSKCTWGHQIYCTAKMTFDSFSVMNAIIQRLDAQTAKIDAQSAKIAELSGRIAAIESEQSEFATPMPMQGELFKEEK